MSETTVPAILEGINLGLITPEHSDFLKLATYRAAFYAEESENPTLEPVINDYRAYFEDWGRYGDTGLLIRRYEAPIGAAWYRHYREEDDVWSAKGSAAPEVAISLVPGEKSRGYGRVLLASLMDLARIRGETALTLHVNLNNVRARRLYTSLGFTTLEPTYYKGRHTGDVMMADLTGGVAEYFLGRSA